MTKVSKKAILKAIDESGGIVEVIVKRLGISRQAYWKWEQKFPELVKERESERERQVDISEVNLFKANKNGERWAVNKILGTLGKSRGYADRYEVEYSGKVDNGFRIEDEFKAFLGINSKVGNKVKKNSVFRLVIGDKV
jgi:ABC-type oligopeptide transport system ATPase subunit